MPLMEQHFFDNGKFSSTVSGRIFVRALFLQTGHSTHSPLCNINTSILFRQSEIYFKNSPNKRKNKIPTTPKMARPLKAVLIADFAFCTSISFHQLIVNDNPCDNLEQQITTKIENNHTSISHDL